MRKILIAGIASLTLALLPVAAQAGESTLTGAAIGAGAGAIVLGPVGAVAGGAIGAWVGGPRISRTSAHKRCWRDDAGVRHCHWR
jgi:outer membrane lipoprotein SlyB